MQQLAPTTAIQWTKTSYLGLSRRRRRRKRRYKSEFACIECATQLIELTGKYWLWLVSLRPAMYTLLNTS